MFVISTWDLLYAAGHLFSRPAVEKPNTMVSIGGVQAPHPSKEEMEEEIAGLGSPVTCSTERETVISSPSKLKSGFKPTRSLVREFCTTAAVASALNSIVWETVLAGGKFWLEKKGVCDLLF